MSESDIMCVYLTVSCKVQYRLYLFSTRLPKITCPHSYTYSLCTELFKLWQLHTFQQIGHSKAAARYLPFRLIRFFVTNFEFWPLTYNAILTKESVSFLTAFIRKFRERKDGALT